MKKKVSHNIYGHVSCGTLHPIWLQFSEHHHGKNKRYVQRHPVLARLSLSVYVDLADGKKLSRMIQDKTKKF